MSTLHESLQYLFRVANSASATCDPEYTEFAAGILSVAEQVAKAVRSEPDAKVVRSEPDTDKCEVDSIIDDELSINGFELHELYSSGECLALEVLEPFIKDLEID